MALQLFDRVLVAATANTTVSFTLGSAVAGYQSFSVMTNGDTTYYGASDGTNWEVGLGTYASSGPTLTRTTILSSSNSGSAVTFSGSPNVWIDYPAGKSVYADASSKVSGYVIENSTIGSTTASTGKFTSVTTPSVTATTTDLTLNAISTGVVNLNTVGGTSFKASQAFLSGTAVNYIDASGRQTGLGPILSVNGSDADVRMNITAKGTGSIGFYTNLANTLQMQITPTASAVNYVQITGGATTAAPVLSSQGSDSNIALSFVSKGTARHNFFNNGATSSRQFAVGTSGITSAVNFLNVDGSVAGIALPMQAQGTDTNISMAFQPKGTGAIDLAAGSSGVNLSNGGTVTAITRTSAGSLYTSIPSTAITAPTTAGGVQATASAIMGINTVVIANGGTGYTVGNTLTLVGGTGTVATLTVSTVSSGVITAVTIATFGSYSAIPTSPVSVTGGSGSGATFTLTWGVGTFTITNAGSGYIEQPTITFSGGGGSGAAAYATVGSATTVKSLNGTMSFNTPAGESVRINNGGFSTLTDYVELRGGASVSGAYVTVGGSTANASLYLSSKASSNIQFYTNSFNQEQLRVSHTASAVNYVQVTGNTTTNRPTISAQGSDANAGLSIFAKGTGGVFIGSNLGTTAAIISTPTTGVNYFNITGTAAGSAPVLSVAGSDTNIDLALTPKGTGGIVGNVNSGTFTINRDSTSNAIKFTAPNANMYIQSTGGGVILFNTADSSAYQMRINHTASAVNYVQVTGGATGNSPVVSVAGSDANLDLTLTPKGTGNVRFGTYTASILTPTGYIEIKDSGGTVRRLLVG